MLFYYAHGKEANMKKLVLVSILVIAIASIALAQTGVKKKRPLPADYGKVVMNNHSERAGMAPVVFDHWVHRSRFTCRLCHVDIAFGMKAGTTGVRASDNINGYYCGSCHNGKMKVDDRKVLEACAKKHTDADMPRCDRCHSQGKVVKREYDFAKVTEKLPKELFGNGINWEKAEEVGLIKLTDYLEGISIKRPPMKVQKDFELSAKVEGIPDIIFSHRKHTVWNGCELCHPEIFYGVKKGTTKYSMPEIFEGKYCGVCHKNVAFPLIDCQRCHTKPVQQS
jgi:c(7)-type cytochrome triheme protein